MDLSFITNLFFLVFADGLDFITDMNAGVATEFMPVNPPLFIIVGIVLVIATIFILFFLKKMIMNTILGAIIWFVAIYILKINLPLIPSLVVSLIIGPAGIGTMLLLNAFGLLAI
jgi:hypothetical protein